jgi:hypothetical protein
MQTGESEDPSRRRSNLERTKIFPMSDISKVRFLVYDHGFFLELALRLARDAAEVFYCVPWEDGQSKINKRVIGDGFGEIERVSEPWGLIDAGKVDCVVFPDIHHAEMQLHIEKLGIPVWGSRMGEKLELNKIAFKRIQEELGMNHADYDVINGLEELREHCRKNEDRWIKITPQFRGNKETFHHSNFDDSREDLDEMAVEFGFLQNLIRFISEKSIKSKLEGGLDTYIVDGQRPDVAVQGYEKKDQGYFAVVQNWGDIPKQITRPTEMLLPLLKRDRYRNFHSNEVKILETEESIILEPTCRMPSPAGEEQMEIYDNVTEIISEGAQGKLVQPIITHKFACEAMMEHNGDDEHMGRTLKIPNSVRRWYKLYNAVNLGDRIGITPGQTCIGAVVGIGDSPKECLEHLLENVAALKDEPVTVHVESIAAIIQEIEEAEEAGIHFSDKPLPEPADALAEPS